MREAKPRTATTDQDAMRRHERRALVREMGRIAMAASEHVQLLELRRRTRAAWAAGNYHAVAQSFWDVGARIVRRVAIGPGEDVIDVACGTGNAAIRAAQAGARVVGVDLAPELFEAGRAIAAEAGVSVEWREGDAESLPVDDATFDVALSTFGCMFAPRHEIAAGELVRVLRPGGRIGLTSWTPEGALGSPVVWGREDHVRDLFDGMGVELEFERETVDFRYPSVADAVARTAGDFGPLVKARELLEPQGRWEALREDINAFFADHDVAPGDEVVVPGEYLVVVGRKTTDKE